MKKYNKFFLIITGPTGVGKTALVQKLVQKLKLQAEIVNADVGQFYKPLSIGTAKHDVSQEIVPHHLFDKFKMPINYTSHEYRIDVLSTLEKIWQSSKLPIIVGGSGFYLKSLFFPPKVSDKSYLKSADAKTAQNEFSSDYSKYNKLDLWNKLAALDPERAKKIHPNDRYRVERALILIEQGKKLSSSYKPEFECPSNCGIIFLNRERSELYSAINHRVNEMFDHGWVDEVLALKAISNNNDWFEFLKRKKLIGYPEIIDYINNTNIDSKNLGYVKEIIAQKTRAYAKRQITFWRSFKEQLQESDPNQKCIKFCYELNLTLLDVDLYLDLIVNKCLSFGIIQTPIEIN